MFDELRKKSSSSRQLAVVLLVGAGVGVVIALFGFLRYAPLVGWDTAALVYLVWVWRTILPLDARATAELAVREDPNRNEAHVVLLIACVVSLVAVGFYLTSASSGGGRDELRIAVGVVSVVLSWAVVHTLYTARYARLYYTGADGGIDFHQDSPPRYADFAYVAFTIGMTFQVSDTDVTSREVRGSVLAHSLISYLFGAAVIAATVNLLASLAS